MLIKEGCLGEKGGNPETRLGVHSPGKAGGTGPAVEMGLNSDSGQIDDQGRGNGFDSQETVLREIPFGISKWLWL